MLALLLAPFYIVLNIYILRHSLKWLDACPGPLRARPLKILWRTIYAFFVLLPLTSFLLPSSETQRLLAWLSSFWLGFLLYLSLLVLAADGIFRLLRRVRRRACAPMPESGKARRLRALAGTIICICTAAICVCGVLHASNIKVTHYEIALDKACGGRNSLRIVLAADFHLGYSVGSRHMERMTALINDQNADLVCFAGDEFDNSYEALDDPVRIAEILSGIRSKYGVYACYGNHDIDERLLAGFSVALSPSLTSDPRMDRLLESAGITLLRDESVLIDNSFYLVGRRDASKTGLSAGRKTISTLLKELPAPLPGPSNASVDPLYSSNAPSHVLDPLNFSGSSGPFTSADVSNNKAFPIVVLDHQPKELKLLEEAGVDLALSGHTHDGQLFPANLLVRAAWENPCGLLQKGSLYSVVTSGVGVWGPNMRVLTDSEIVVIDVFFDPS